MADLGNHAEKKFEIADMNVWRVLRDGKETKVDEKDLTLDEERVLRTSELVQEFSLTSLLDEKERLAREIEKRQDRNGRLRMMVGGRQLVIELADKVERIQDGKVPSSDLTDKEASRLEELYVRTMPYATLTSNMEGRLRTEIRKIAIDDHLDGKFQTINDALKHYGLSEEIE